VTTVSFSRPRLGCDVAGARHGFVDVFDTDGHLIRRFESRGRVNSPCGITRASFAFGGPYSGKILFGNFGDGRINVFNNDRAFVDQLEDAHGKPLVIDGLLNSSNALQSFSPRATVANVAASSGLGCTGSAPNKLNRLASWALSQAVLSETISRLGTAS
jgi:hypothetical protein